LSTGDNNGDTAYHYAVRLATTTTSCMDTNYDATELWPRILKALAAGYDHQLSINHVHVHSCMRYRMI
jgi:hypothetical protein